jgi:hypothetical protein
MSDLFFRQVNPGFLSESGAPKSCSFRPTKKDKGKLSVDDANKTSAEDSYRHFTENLGLKSAGTWAVSSEEVGAHRALVIESSPLSDNHAHCSIDFTAISSKGQIRRISQTLAAVATERGCLFEA